MPIFLPVSPKLKHAFAVVVICAAALLSIVAGWQFQTELSFYRAIIKGGPHSPVAAYNLGNALMRTKQVDEAISQYREVLNGYPGHPRASTHNNLSVALLQTDQVDEALHHARRAVFLAPRNARYHYNLALAQMKQKQWTEFGVSLERALSLQPDYPDAKKLAKQLCGSRHRHVAERLCEP